MTDADNKDTSQTQETQDQASNSGTSKVDQQLSEIARMLAEQNQQFQAALEAATAKNNSTKTIEVDADPVYDSKGFKRQVLDEADKIAQRAVARERELNTAVYNLAQDYPEISSDAALKRAIQENQRALPESIRDTAIGYETAILKAVNKAGLLPKSKRPAESIDEDVAMGSGRSASSASGSKKQSKTKLSEETLAVAQLLGRDINDPKVLKGLEQANSRGKWSKYE